MSKEYIECEAAKERLRIWITDCVLDGDDEAADCFRDCIDLLDSIPAADVAPTVELEDLRAKYQVLVAEKTRIAETLLKHIQPGIAMVTETGRLNCSNRF